MNRSLFVAMALLAAAVIAPVALRAANAPVVRPNVVLIFADDKCE